MFSIHSNRPEVSLLFAPRGRREGNHLVVVLRALHRLLEDHAPEWYTYEHHRSGELGLRQDGARRAEGFLMLYDLLREYAPRWYPGELRNEAELAAERLEKLEGRPPNGCRPRGVIPEIDSRDPGR